MSRATIAATVSSTHAVSGAGTILVAASAGGLGYFDPVMLVIIALLAILFLSYWQTIEAYPKSGGAYTSHRLARAEFLNWSSFASSTRIFVGRGRMSRPKPEQPNGRTS